MRWAVLVVAIAACSSKSKDESPPAQPSQHANPFEAFDTSSPKIGEPAPAFTLDDVDGKHVSLSDACAKGPVVLVWGSFS